MDTHGADAGLLKSRYRLTKQRAAVLSALDDGAHLTAEALLERVRHQLPGVSLGTIYRTVEILREIGLVQVFTHNGMAARYEASLSKHHHLVCERCHDIVNVSLPSLGTVVEAIAERYDFGGIDASLTVTGTCSPCAAATGAARREALAPLAAIAEGSRRQRE
jgi:Fur family ferric uptake transcriptional regulator